MRLVCFSFAMLTVLTACEPEIGRPCDADPDEVLNRVIVKEGQNDLVKDVAFDDCSTALCASVGGSRPYCTKECESDQECAEAGPGFTCQVLIDFGPLACRDFTPADQCGEADGDDDEFPCDCIDGDGNASALPIKYCSADAATIAARDAEFGREPFKAPEE